MSRDYRKLTVFQLADELAVGIYHVREGQDPPLR